MRVFKLLDAIYDRLAGFLLGGVLNRLQAHQALQEAQLTGELEAHARAHKSAGNDAAADVLTAALGQENGDPAVDGVHITNLLLSDEYVDEAPAAEAAESPVSRPTTRRRPKRVKGRPSRRPETDSDA